LDLTWCYFKMKDVSFKKDAEWRLKTAQNGLERSHGKNYERLVLLKGTAGPDLVLWARLYLLQGILAFHSNKTITAHQCFSKADEVLQMLHVDENQMVELMGMGFTESESRLALRANYKDIQGAASWILKRREEREAVKAEERKRRREEKEKRKYGKTANGLWVDLNVLTAIEAMGFEKKLVVEALKQTDNNQDMALNLLTQSPELLSMKDSKKRKKDYTEEIKQIETMGFSASAALGTLMKTNGNVERAMEVILAGQGVEYFPENDTVNESASTENMQVDTNKNSGTTENEQKLQEQIMLEEEKARQEQEEKMKKTEDELIEDMPNEEESHLDITLDEEETVLTEYKTLMQTSKPN